MVGALGLGLFALMVLFGILGRVDVALVVGAILFLTAGAAIGLIRPMVKLAIIGGACFLIASTLHLVGG